MEDEIDTASRHLERGLIEDVADGEDELVGHSWIVGRVIVTHVIQNTETVHLGTQITYELKKTG